MSWVSRARCNMTFGSLYLGKRVSWANELFYEQNEIWKNKRAPFCINENTSCFASLVSLTYVTMTHQLLHQIWWRHINYHTLRYLRDSTPFLIMVCCSDGDKCKHLELPLQGWYFCAHCTAQLHGPCGILYDEDNIEHQNCCHQCNEKEQHLKHAGKLPSFLTSQHLKHMAFGMKKCLMKCSYQCARTLAPLERFFLVVHDSVRSSLIIHVTRCFLQQKKALSSFQMVCIAVLWSSTTKKSQWFCSWRWQ